MSSPKAVVVGLCAHGLTITRSLAKSGIEVIAIEANRSLPGCSTNSAKKESVEDINGPGLVKDLIRLAPDFSNRGRPVLFLTNDSMISTVGSAIAHIDSLYELSWSKSADTVLRLLRKSEIQEQAQATDLLYPRSRTITSADDIKGVTSDLQFPVIVKPDRPISAYKTLIIETAKKFFEAWPKIRTALPALVQEYIPGGEENTQFSAIYYNNGQIVARHEGRKLRSRPLGHTTIAISERNDLLHNLTRQFFDNLNLTGPVSLEFKEDSHGRHWVIEPTVGRTDFWVGLCIADGVDLPLIEYCDQLENREVETAARHDALWINEERDPFALLWLFRKHRQALFSRRIVSVFANMRDPLPFAGWCIRSVMRLPGRVYRRAKRLLTLNA